MMMTVLTLLLRGVVVLAIVVAALVVGDQLRASREHLATGQAATAATTGPLAASITPTVVPTATAPSTPPHTPRPTMAPPRTIVPTPIPTQFTGVRAHLSGRVTAGGKPVRGAVVIVYPSNTSNRGPTPVPPEEAKTTTDDQGAYRVLVPPGAYRVGVFRSQDATSDPADGFAAITWYGDGYAIGLGKDLVVTGDASIDIAMLPVVKLSGRVVGRDGVGVPNVHVTLSRSYGGIDFPLVPLGEPRTDGSGAFRLAIAAMPLTLQVQAPGLKDSVWSRMDLDLRGDRADIVVIIERGHVVSGTLRDAAGRPLANMNFGVEAANGQNSCGGGLCSSRTDGAGRFMLSVPTGTLRFRNWPETPTTPEIYSKDYRISGDMTLDPVLEPR